MSLGIDDDSGSLKSILRSRSSSSRGGSYGGADNKLTDDDSINQNNIQYKLAVPDPSRMLDLETQTAGSDEDYKLRLNKLLKCNYTGISNLYWCDSSWIDIEQQLD